ncbi:MAG: hypothetical protein K2X27_12375 [Candidatus Obscuribacterales bacterium]|nr:hypothetical protein [Candidatus Obscuribacterales bacterium]
MQHAVNAILSGQEQSIRCADALKKAGFTRDEISVLLPDDFGAQELGFERRSKATLGFTIGAIFGLILGLEFGYFAFMWHGSIPVLPALSQANVCSALAMAAIVGFPAALLGSLIGMMIPEYVVCKYDRKTRLGSSLISVHVDNAKEMRLAEKILRYEGAQEISFADEGKDRRKPAQLAVQ